jgi:hypothetical protein
MKTRRLAGITCISRLIAACPIARCSLNFQFVQLVPFRVSTITLRYGKQLANPAAWIKGGRSGSLNLNWRGVGFVLQGVPDLSSKKMNYGNHCNFKLANDRIRETLLISTIVGCG